MCIGCQYVVTVIKKSTANNNNPAFTANFTQMVVLLQSITVFYSAS